MKKAFLPIFLVIAALCTTLHGQNAPRMLKGAIASSQIDLLPSFKIYYQGIQVESNDDGFFTIPLETEQNNNLSLIVCKDFIPNFDSINTIKHLTIQQNKSYKFFTFSRATLPTLKSKIEQLEQNKKPVSMRLKLANRQINRQEQTISHLTLQNQVKETTYNLEIYKSKLSSLKKTKTRLVTQEAELNKQIKLFQKKYEEFQNNPGLQTNADFWFIKEKSLETEQFVIPNNCVVVCMNPKIVDRLENWKFPLARNITALPRIVLKANLEIENKKRVQSITRSALKSELYSLDAQVFHEPKREETQNSAGKPEVKVTLVR
ncbi:hypothetical protein KAT92_00210 [Candidatus Babeliales bacterium]|nr:hypothetical protein [Candidatus Babeliales bacterium]